MSIVTLKKKTQAKYNNASVGQAQFSINGVHRLQGYIGQTSLSRCLPKTLKFAGVGVLPQDIWTTEDSQTVKSSVLSNQGRIQTHYQWVRRPQPFSSWKPDSSQSTTASAYTRYKEGGALQSDYLNSAQALEPRSITTNCDTCIMTKKDISNMSQSTYIQNLCKDSTCQPLPRIRNTRLNIPLPGN